MTRLLMRYLRPYFGIVITIVSLALLQSLSELYLPTLMSDIVDRGVVEKDIPFIWRTGGNMLLVALGGIICSIGAGYWAARTSLGLSRDLRTKVFTRIENFSMDEFDKFGVASLITRTTNDIVQVGQVTFMLLRMAVSAPMMCIGGIIMAVNKDARLSLIIVITMPILIGVIAITAGRGVPLFKLIQGKIDRLNLVMREHLTGIRVVRAFNRTTHEEGRFDEANRNLTDLSTRVNRIMGSMMPSMMLIFNITTLAVIWFGAHRIDRGQMQVGSLMAFIQYISQIMFSLIMLSMMFIFVPRAAASAERITEVLETVPVIEDPPAGKAPMSNEGLVEFDGVSFTYPGAEEPALRDISFSAKPGTVTAIIGGTGSGKSTLVSLIPRFSDVSFGSIKVDGVDVRDMKQEVLRQRLGFVPQQVVLFSGTVSTNLLFGKEDADANQMRIAAETAQASEFIDELDKGFDSFVAQGGANFSGGQKQRLSIARALVRKPSVYIFDDSFSALDFKTDARLRMALRRYAASSTVILVAQRIGTVIDADQIVVLDEGRIVGIGTHKELLLSCQVYQEIAASQLTKEELA